MFQPVSSNGSHSCLLVCDHLVCYNLTHWWLQGGATVCICSQKWCTFPPISPLLFLFFSRSGIIGIFNPIFRWKVTRSKFQGRTVTCWLGKWLTAAILENQLLFQPGFICSRYHMILFWENNVSLVVADSLESLFIFSQSANFSAAVFNLWIFFRYS